MVALLTFAAVVVTVLAVGALLFAGLIAAIGWAGRIVSGQPKALRSQRRIARAEEEPLE